MVRPDETTGLSQSGIIFTPGMTKLRSELLGIQTHGAEFVYVERAPESADTFLLEDDTSSIFPANGNIAKQE